MTVSMALPLPFELPFADGVSLVSSYDFADFKATFLRNDAVVKRTDFPDETYPYTTIHLTVDPKGTLRPISDDPQPFLYGVFVASLRYVNRFLDATRALRTMSPVSAT